jgi:hypothetical protein
MLQEPEYLKLLHNLLQEIEVTAAEAHDNYLWAEKLLVVAE